MTSSRLHRWEGAELESAPSSACSPTEISCPDFQSRGAAASLTLWPQYPESRRSRALSGPWAWPCRSPFTIGTVDNPLRRFGKPHFSSQETDVQGKEVTGPGLTRTRMQHLGPQEGPFTQITLRSDGGAGKSLHLNTLFIP